MKKLLPFLCILSIMHGDFVKSQNTNVTLAAKLSYGKQVLSNLWGWKSPVDGKEYALVGAENGLSIVDVTIPAHPVQLVQIPGPPCEWREVKTWGNYAYVTTECGAIGLQIVDLTALPDTNLSIATWAPTIHNQALNTIHALDVEKGKMYLYGTNVRNQGCIIADVSGTPMNPVYLGSYDPNYIHDGYVRNDTIYAAHIFDNVVSVADVRNPAAPVVLATFWTPGAYPHNTWLSADSKTCFTTDEVNNSFLTSFNVSDLGNISELDRIQSNPGSGSVVHNTYILQKKGVDFAVTSWYKDGITLVDASRPHNLVQVGNYDTSPLSGNGNSGCWGVYPFLPSGTIIASDMQEGLFVLTPTYVRACYLEGNVTDCNTGQVINGMKVTLHVPNPQSNANTCFTNVQGKYAIGDPAPGTYQVVFSKIGFLNDTDTVSISAGTITVWNKKICPVSAFSLTGKVYDHSTMQGIAGASVRIQDKTQASQWNVLTDTYGNFTIPNMISGNFELISGKWGYMTKCVSNEDINPSSAPISQGLDKGIYDDFTWDWGWTVSSNATSGKWERGKPMGTKFMGDIFNPDTDVPTDCSGEAYITGNKGVTALDDVLAGTGTTLTSPTFDLSGYKTPRLFYSLWYKTSTQQGGFQGDTVSVTMSNGITTATLPNYYKTQWSNYSFIISNYIVPTSTMNLIIRVSDKSALDSVHIEAGVDQFFIKEMGDASVNDIQNKINVFLSPNPFSDHTSLILTGANDLNINNLELKFYNLMGQEVYMDAVPNTHGFLINKGNSSPGIYFYKLTERGMLVSTGKIVKE